MYPNLLICHATSVLCLLQCHLLPYLHLSSSCHIATTLLSPCVVNSCSAFHRPWHRHSLAKHIASNGHKSISNMLRGFHPMGCNPNDTQMIVSYHMGDPVFSHSKAVRPQILSLITVVYIRFRQHCSNISIGSETPAILQIERRGFKSSNINFPAIPPN